MACVCVCGVCVCVVCVCVCVFCVIAWWKTCVRQQTLSAPVSVLECVVKERDLSIVKAECLCVGGPSVFLSFACLFF